MLYAFVFIYPQAGDVYKAHGFAPATVDYVIISSLYLFLHDAALESLWSKAVSGEGNNLWSNLGVVGMLHKMYVAQSFYWFADVSVVV